LTARPTLGPILAPIGPIKPLPSLEAVAAMFAAVISMAFNFFGGFTNGLAVATAAGLPAEAYYGVLAEAGPVFIQLMTGAIGPKAVKGDLGDDGGPILVRNQALTAELKAASATVRSVGCDPSMLEAFLAQAEKGTAAEGPKADCFGSTFKVSGGKTTE
jgi:Rieske Fe-S protein